MTTRAIWEAAPWQSGGGKLVSFDDERGEVIDQPPLKHETGYCFRLGDSLLALYVDDDKLVFQIGTDKFNLSEPNVRATKRTSIALLIRLMD